MERCELVKLCERACQVDMLSSAVCYLVFLALYRSLALALLLLLILLVGELCTGASLGRQEQRAVPP